MTKSLLFSTLLHLSFIVLFLFKQEMQEQTQQEKQSQAEQQGNENFEVQVIEQTISQEEIIKEKKLFNISQMETKIESTF